MNKRKEKENSEIKFLFFFSPENVSINSFVCYDIKTGVIITSFNNTNLGISFKINEI